MKWASEVLLPAILIVPGLVFLANTGDLGVYFREPVPPGQFLYVLARLAGLYAFVLIWLQIVLGAFRPQLESRLGHRHLVTVHVRLGAATLVLLASHVALFLAAVALRTGHVPIHLVWPDLTADYYRRMLSMGALALWLVAATSAAAFLRRQPWMIRSWRKVHAANYAVFGLVFVHSRAIGSETRLEPLGTLYGIFLATALAAFAVARCTRASGPRPAPGPAHPRGTS